MTTLNFTVGTVTDRGLNTRRTANEDRLLVMPEAGLFIVADGVGGHRGGQVASQTAIDIFSEVFRNPPARDLLSVVKQTLKYANESIYKASHEVADLDGMASTIVIVAIEGKRAIISHVGDSRVYRFDGKKLFLETEDHSEVNDALRAGKITYDEALNHPHRNIISRALGADFQVEPDFKMITIDDRTSFLLCSDGITRHVSDAELERLMRSGSHPNEIGVQLKDICYSRGAEDNLTAVIVDCGERAYIEEATRPVIGKNTLTTPTKNVTSVERINVSFSEPLSTATTNKIPATVKNKKSSWISGLVQFVILIGIIALVFIGGKNWDRIYSFITGKPMASPLPTGAVALPTPINPSFGAAKSLFEEKRFDKARQSFVELVANDPNNAEYHYWLGRSHLELKQYDEAIKHLNEAAKVDPNLPDIFVQLAYAYDAKGDKKNASENLKKATANRSSPSPSPTPTATPAG